MVVTIRSGNALFKKREKTLSNSRISGHRLLNHPVQIVLLVSAMPLFLCALLADWAYSASFQIQWINFASWLISGALLFLGGALLWTVIEAMRADAPRGIRKWIFVGLVGVSFLIGFVNALVHAKDAWATMPAGLILSVILFILIMVSIWYGFARPQKGEPA